jgi:cellulose synthase/poly-beta-1,6-N-acetylglucosamine synthase-like glycosyltransferase
MRVGICIPSRGDMMIGTAFDLATMCGYDSRFREGDQAIYTVNGTLIFDQRNKLAQAALDDNCDYVLWVDADMRFPKNTLERLLAHDKDIVGVNATTRAVPVKPTAKNLTIDYEKKENHWLPVDSKGKTGIEQVTAIGCGVMLVKRKVFEQTPKPWFYFYELPGGKTLGEDVHFCVAAHDAGFETWVDHGLSQEIGHIGQYTYTWGDVIEPNQLQRAAKHNRKLSRKNRPK